MEDPLSIFPYTAPVPESEWTIIKGLLDGWIDGWMDEWMDGWLEGTDP